MTTLDNYFFYHELQNAAGKLDMLLSGDEDKSYFNSFTKRNETWNFNGMNGM